MAYNQTRSTTILTYLNDNGEASIATIAEDLGMVEADIQEQLDILVDATHVDNPDGVQHAVLDPETGLYAFVSQVPQDVNHTPAIDGLVAAACQVCEDTYPMPVTNELFAALRANRCVMANVLKVSGVSEADFTAMLDAADAERQAVPQ